MSNLRNSLCHVYNIFSHVDRLHVAFRFEYMVVVLSDLGVKGDNRNVLEA